jgi:hypothetical protein
VGRPAAHPREQRREHGGAGRYTPEGREPHFASDHLGRPRPSSRARPPRSCSSRPRGVAGRHFEDGNDARIVRGSRGWIEGVAPWAIGPVDAERLWDVSPSMIAAAA